MVGFNRETSKDGSVKLSSERCTYVYQRLRPGVVLVHLRGDDRGDLGAAPRDELHEDLRRHAPVELFFDMDESTGATLPVQEAWTEWFSQHRSALKTVNILTRSKYMHVSVEMAKLFSRTGELIRVYLEAEPFHEALQRAAPEARREPGS